MIDEKNIDENVLIRAFVRWGVEPQINQMQEECGELIVAINHFRRSRILPIKLAEEIADVYIMCQELAMIFGVDLVDEQVRFKINRLRDKLDHNQAMTEKEV